MKYNFKNTQEYDDENTEKGLRNTGHKIRRANTCKLESQRREDNRTDTILKI